MVTAGARSDSSLPVRGIPPPISMLGVAIAAAFLYLVLVGLTPAGEWHGVTRAISTLIGAGVVLAYVVAVRRHADRTDAWTVGALLCFTVATITSELPRQSIDALIAMLAYVAAFSLLRLALPRHGVRGALVVVLMGLSLATTLLACGRLAGSVVGWWQLTGTAPPIGIGFSSTPWGHPYDFTLLAVLLWPIWLLGERNRLRSVVAGVLGLLLLVVVLLQGSRAIWLAIVAATLLVLGPRAALLFMRRRPSAPVVIGAVAAAVVIVLVLGAPLLTRLLTGTTIEQRLEMWGAAMAVWVERPLTGFGPGTFPWVLQTTGYFDTNSLAPRHPDSAVFQLVPEAGLVGIVGVLLLLVGIGLPILRRGPAPAAWALSIFVFAGLTMNPSDFGFLIVVAIAWAAIGTPKPAGEAVARQGRVPLAAWALLGVAAAVPVVMAVIAGLRYDDARNLAQRGDLAAAIEELDAAVALDHSMGLYARQRGTAHLLQGDLPAATRDLSTATRLNPYDDLAWRTLAIAHRHAARDARADAALERAIRLQRSDPTNLLLRIRWDVEDGGHERAGDLLGEVVLAWPEIIGAPAWPDLVPPTDSTARVVDRALKRWEDGLPSASPLTLQPLWLAAVAGRTDVGGAGAALAEPLRDAYVAVVGCGSDADALLERVPLEQRRNGTYWRLLARQETQEGAASDAADRALAYFRASRPDDARRDALLNPLRGNDQLGYFPDEWGYRRLPIAWDSPGPPLPDPTSGELTWTYAPERAAAIAEMPTSCLRIDPS